MSSIKAWQRVLSQLQERFVGGDCVEEAISKGVFRGPISEITIKGRTLTISGPWCAHLEEDGWVNWHTAVGKYSLEYCGEPQEICGGRLRFISPFSCVILIPKGDSQLDPALVRGLEVPS